MPTKSGAISKQLQGSKLPANNLTNLTHKPTFTNPRQTPHQARANQGNSPTNHNEPNQPRNLLQQCKVKAPTRSHSPSKSLAPPLQRPSVHGTTGQVHEASSQVYEANQGPVELNGRRKSLLSLGAFRPSTSLPASDSTGLMAEMPDFVR